MENYLAKSGILHVGLPKTGTTSFQNAIYHNRDRLLSDHRLLYPSIEANHTNALCTMFLDDPRTHITNKINGITELEDAKKLRDNYYKKLEDDIESADWDKLVFSAEGLCNLPAPALSRLHDWLNKYTDKWLIMFWSRHPVTYAASSMQQLMKNGYHIGDMEENPKRFMPNFKGRLTAAFKAFGMTSVQLTTFEDALEEPGGVVSAFCRRLGLDDDVSLDLSQNSKRDNESLSLLAAHILDSINRQRPLFVDGKINPKRRNGEVPFVSHLGGPKFDLPVELKNTVKHLSRPDVAWLNEIFGTSHYMDVFDDDRQKRNYQNQNSPIDIIDPLALLISDLINLVKR